MYDSYGAGCGLGSRLDANTYTAAKAEQRPIVLIIITVSLTGKSHSFLKSGGISLGTFRSEVTHQNLYTKTFPPHAYTGMSSVAGGHIEKHGKTKSEE